MSQAKATVVIWIAKRCFRIDFVITGDTTEHGAGFVGEKKRVFPGSGERMGEIRETRKNE